jgi:peroxisomal 2,4-dienoyl-CoA reductase
MPRLIGRPIGDTAGMDRLTPKGYDMAQAIPLGRMGHKGECLLLRRGFPYTSAEDIANAALFLLSPAASWITGTVVVRLTISSVAN